MVIGFTGTRYGMTRDQITKVIAYMLPYNTTAAIGLHGDCVGADADFNAICEGLGLQVQCRPCDIVVMRANTGAAEVAPPMPPMARNRLIVRHSDRMIACPAEFIHKERSGTWATMGFAEKAGKHLYVVYPDGDTFTVGA